MQELKQKQEKDLSELETSGLNAEQADKKRKELY